MCRYVFVTCESSNLEVLYAGFNIEEYGYICLPFPWDPFIKRLSPDKKNEYYSNIIKTSLPDFDESIHFIVYGRLFEWKSVSIVDILRKIYSHSKISCYFGDLIQSHDLILNDVKNICDYVFTFDFGEAEKYSIHFCQEPYSGIDYRQYEIVSDVCFIGRAKDRLSKILAVYEHLSSLGLICDFYVVDAPEEERKYCEKIQYGNLLDYGESLKHIKQSKCILEIMQSNANSPSTRFAEALIYNKLLLTDCAIEVRDKMPNIIYFEDIKKCDLSLIRANYIYDNSEWIKYFSVEEMIRTIQKVEKI